MTVQATVASGTIDPDRQAVVVGCGQWVQRDVEPERALEPLALMERCARLAADDARLSAAALERLDAVVAVNVLGWRYGSAARLLAGRLGARGARAIDTSVGGNTPQLALTELARRIARGECDLALVAGAEAIRARRRARKAGVALDWTQDAGSAGDERLGDERRGTSEREERHGIALPPQVYPLFENALRARLGETLEAHRLRIGRLWSRFSRVAAANPHAWFREARSAEEIATPTRTNRMIAWPYTKYLNAILEVDQGAAVLVCSAARARALGVPADRRVWLWSGADAAEDPWFVSERPRLDACPAQAIALGGALAAAGVEAAEISAFDLYSCFPVAVELACEALGVAEDDPRPLTTTGGLAYAGGPGNDYSLHGIARLVEQLRAEGGLGLVSALGWFLTKHSVGVYGAEPPRRRPQPAPEVARGTPPEMTDAPESPGVVEAYTVVHDREGAPERAIVLGRDAAGRRFAANTPPDRPLLEDMERREMVGARGRVAPAPDGRVLFAPE